MALKHSIGAPGPVVEKQLLGLCHAELGGALLKNWGLPESIYQPVFYHHRQDSVPLRHQVSVEILSLADKISAIYHGSQSSSNLAQVVKSLSDQYGLSEEEIKKLIDNVASRANEMMDFFDIPGGNIRPLSEMLQEANRELGQLNCNYEQLVMELKQTREESSQYVSKLIDANKKYRELAYLDELTGIYNNHYFQKVMDVELARTNRYKRALSLLFLDVDHFKQCNDNHGHLAGDTVLRQVALNIQQIMRASDSVVRYGGDEFAVILPETDSKGLEVFAERIRRSIANMRIDIDDTQMQVTVSVGGATFDGNNPTIDKRDLLRAADQALYQSKREGRNRTSIAADI